MLHNIHWRKLHHQLCDFRQSKKQIEGEEVLAAFDDAFLDFKDESLGIVAEPRFDDGSGRMIPVLEGMTTR